MNLRHVEMGVAPMNEKFKEMVDKMSLRLKQLSGKTPISIDKIGLTDVPKQGVYVFYEKTTPIYVGRSNRMKERLKEHSQSGSDRWSATLALRIAKKDMQTQQKKLTNDRLMEDSDFFKKFNEAKKRIANTEIRFIEIKDQAEQSVFEIYAAFVLKTELNDFGTH